MTCAYGSPSGRSLLPAFLLSLLAIVPSAPAQTGASIEGRWSVNFNGYTGTAEFTRSGSGWVGSLNLGQGAESLTSVSFDSRTGAVSFIRPTVNQHYSGTLSGNGMSGRFDNAYNWSATRVAR